MLLRGHDSKSDHGVYFPHLSTELNLICDLGPSLFFFSLWIVSILTYRLLDTFHLSWVISHKLSLPHPPAATELYSLES
jgi:hypothetical protein